MNTYADQLKKYQNFIDTTSFKKSFNLFRKKFRYELTKSDNNVLYMMTGYAVKFPGACKLQLETIAELSGVSVATVKRAIAKAVKFGIIKRINTRKDNGRRQGATVYQFQQFISELQDEPQRMSYRENDEMLCDSKVEGTKKNTEVPISLSPSLSLKDTNITEQAHTDEKEVVKKTLKAALLNKVPVALKSVGLFFDDAQQLFDLNGVIFNAKASVSKTVRIEEHEALFSKTIKSVYEYWKRQVRNGKTDYNVFGLMRKAIVELTQKIVDGTAYEVQTVKQAPATSKELIPDWMIDNEQDPMRKAQLQAQRASVIADMGKKDIFNYAKVDKTIKAIEQTTTIDFEAERAAMLSKLGF